MSNRVEPVHTIGNSFNEECPFCKTGIPRKHIAVIGVDKTPFKEVLIMEKNKLDKGNLQFDLRDVVPDWVDNLSLEEVQAFKRAINNAGGKKIQPKKFSIYYETNAGAGCKTIRAVSLESAEDIVKEQVGYELNYIEGMETK